MRTIKLTIIGLLTFAGATMSVTIPASAGTCYTTCNGSFCYTRCF